jgi:arylsulfatase A-like enzyme
MKRQLPRLALPQLQPAGGLHLIDIASTILDVAQIPAPKSVNGVDQKPMDGVSIASTFDDAKALPVRERQYFEIFTNRAIYDKGWIACAQHTLPWRQDLAPLAIRRKTNGSYITSTRISAKATTWRLNFRTSWPN